MRQVSRSDEDVLKFVAASFSSVWALELVLTIRRDRRPWPVEELVSSLRASDLVVTKAVDSLVAAGLASLETNGALYLPISSDVDACMERVEELYRTRPNAVRRAIVSATASRATAFANAFKLRGGADD